EPAERDDADRGRSERHPRIVTSFALARVSRGRRRRHSGYAWVRSFPPTVRTCVLDFTTVDPLAKVLTPPQLEAVRHGEGPLLLLGGAGSGKTRVLTPRHA